MNQISKFTYGLKQIQNLLHISELQQYFNWTFKIRCYILAVKFILSMRL